MTEPLRQIGAYPSTSVGRYLLALFGRLWVFDQRRFEAKDLRRLPFPYESAEDLLSNPVTGFEDGDFTEFCTRRFGASDLFTTAVQEHHDLRERYQDGRKPAEGSEPPAGAVLQTYTKVLAAELEAVLAQPVHVEFGRATSARTLSVLAKIGTQERHPQAWQPDHLGEELSLRIHTLRQGLIVEMVKPEVRSAWTAERAYADALAAVRGIMAA